MITIDVQEIKLEPPLNREGLPMFDIEGNHSLWVVKVTSVTKIWREEYTDPERVRAFIRGVKAGSSVRDGILAVFVHVTQPEWNV